MVLDILLISASFILSLVSVYGIKRTKYLIDTPNDRSSHTQPTPRGGGIGFVLAFAVTSAITTFTQTPDPQLLPMWLTLIPLALVGVLDDLWGMPASLRYLVQLTTATIATFSFGIFPQPWLTSLGVPGQVVATLLTIIGFTAIVNFFNFMDGLDGLVAGCTAVQLSFLALFFNQPILWLLVAALVGFLWWNWSPAKIFMGDTGSTVLGASVAISIMSNADHTSQAWAALAITLPLTGDASYTLVRRLLQHKNIFQAHREHIFQRLHQGGWSHDQVAFAYIFMTFILTILISYFGLLGAGISLFLSAIAIGIFEFHLLYKTQSHNWKRNKIEP